MSLLEVKNLSVEYNTPSGKIKALHNLTFTLEKGEVLGFLGESGSGKSTLAYAIMGILPSNATITSGEIIYDGINLLKTSERDIRKIRGRKITLIPQNSMSALSPVHKIGDQMLEILQTHTRYSTKKAMKIIYNRLRTARLSRDVLNKYFHELSGGMRQRVVIAMSLLTNPDIIVADEPTTGLDVIVQFQILKELKSLQKKLGVSLIFISHDVSVIAYLSTKVAVLYGGYLYEYGTSYDVFKNSKNPYTILLLRSHPEIKSKKMEITEIPGSPPNMLNPPSGCIFHPRCPFSEDICKEKVPPLIKVGKDHFSRCFFINKISGENYE